MAKKYKVKEGQTITRGETRAKGEKPPGPHEPAPATKTYQAGEEVELEEHEAHEAWHALEGFDEDPRAKAATEKNAKRETQTPGDVPGLKGEGPAKPGQEGLADRHSSVMTGDAGSQHGDKGKHR